MFTKTEDLKYPVIDNYSLYVHKAESLTKKYHNIASMVEQDGLMSIVSSVQGLHRAHTSLINVKAKPSQMEEALEVMIGSTFDIVQHRAQQDLLSRIDYLELAQEICRDMLVSMKIIEVRRKIQEEQLAYDNL